MRKATEEIASPSRRAADADADWDHFIDELEREILPLYRGHELSFDPQGVHGRMHICRSVLFAEWMARYYLARGPARPDLFAVRAATAFHDSGRRANGPDLWEADSACRCFDYVRGVGSEADSRYAREVSAIIEKGRPGDSLTRQIVHDADVLEIMRPCCGHGGLAGFRREFLRFGGSGDAARSVPDIAVAREALVQECWRWILATEGLKPFLRDSTCYMRDLLRHLARERLKYPLLSELLPRTADAVHPHAASARPNLSNMEAAAPPPAHDLPDLGKYFPRMLVAPPAGQKRRAFKSLWAATLSKGEGSVIEYDCPYPKHEFLTYLVEQENLLLHGSNHMQIKVLLPLRLSQDVTNYGNDDSVYALSDGVWPIYYGIVHRNCPKVSLRSFCRREAGADGTVAKSYYFSIHTEMMRTQPWTRGMVYVLPRETFTQFRDEDGEPVEEWGSREPVEVLAKLPIGPEDFPFLGSVRAHDDTSQPTAPPPPAPVAAGYLGRYALAQGVTLEVIQKGNKLFVNFPGFLPAVMIPSPGGCFRLPPLDIIAAFEGDAPGRASRLTLSWDGRDWVAQKI